MLYELATGERPFKGDTNISIVSSILKDTPTTVTDLNPVLPAGLARVIRKALAKDPSRRYQTAIDIRNDLEELTQEVDRGVTVPVRTAQAVPTGPNRRKRVAGLVIAAVALTAGAIALSKWRSNGAASSAPVVFEVDRITRLTSTGKAYRVAISPDGNYVAHAKEVGTLSGLWIRQTTTTSDVQIVPPAQVSYLGISYAPDGSHVYYTVVPYAGGFATLYKVPVLGGSPQRVVENVQSRISFSPDRRQFTFMRRGSVRPAAADLMIADVDGSNVRTLASLTAPDRFVPWGGPSWSPDGRTILAPGESMKAVRHNMVVAVDVADGATTTLKNRWGDLSGLEWLPDGRSFVVAAAELSGSGTDLQLWQISHPGGEARRLTHDPKHYHEMTVSADARLLATAQVESVSSVWVAPASDPANGQQLATGVGHADGLTGVAWTPDGRIVFGAPAASGLSQIWIADADGSNARKLTNDDIVAQLFSVSPDGRYILFERRNLTRDKAGDQNIWRMEIDGSNATQLTFGKRDADPRAGPRFVYYSSLESGESRPWKVAITGGAPVSLGDVDFWPTDVSPDGRRLAGQVRDAKTRRFVLATMSVNGGPAEILSARAFGAAWSPDGKALTYWNLHEEGVQFFKYALDEKVARPLATFKDSLFAYDWAPDGKQLVLARGKESSDVVIISAKARTQ